jgi:iron(III) transport system substrate-binding protein
MARTFSRRDVLQGSSALASDASVRIGSAAAPPRRGDHAELIAAAKKEGKVVYTHRSIWRPRSGSPSRSRRNIRAFQCAWNAPGAERVFQRIGQDTPAAFRRRRGQLVGRRTLDRVEANGWLAPYLPEDVAKHFPAEHKDPDGMFASVRVTLCPIAYNTRPGEGRRRAEKLRRPARSEMGGKIVKAHPSYSGTILTATYQIARDLAGRISKSSPSSASCRCSRHRSAQEARARRARRSWPTAANTCPCTARRRAIRSRSSIRRKARR